jgi:hypothetical protein
VVTSTHVVLVPLHGTGVEGLEGVSVVRCTDRAPQRVLEPARAPYGG